VIIELIITTSIGFTAYAPMKSLKECEAVRDAYLAIQAVSKAIGENDDSEVKCIQTTKRRSR
jgi:hypothetical protein